MAVTAVLNTQIAVSASAVSWTLLSTPWTRVEHLQQGPSVVDILNGVVAGLAGITPAGGYIDTAGALVLGFVLGVSTFFLAQNFREWTGIDDALDVTIVHGVSGAIGALSIGILGTKAVNADGKDGLLYGGDGHLLAIQALAIVVAAAWAAVATLGILVLLQFMQGNIRHRDEDEHHGLDSNDHDVSAYDFPRSTSTAGAREVDLDEARDGPLLRQRSGYGSVEVLESAAPEIVQPTLEER